ncbi:MAG: hypothetical protein EOP45_02615 [Sphingobacteriaceae bacterium]|nr:MAG: hypothetical protein EOP45_02615 [Sphingobacteriaceae bacterium]
MLDDEITDFEFIEEVIRHNKDAKSKVCFELWQNHAGEGAPSVDDFEITEVFFDNNYRHGTIAVDYVINFYFGCDGMNNSAEVSETINFDLNLIEKSITFMIPDNLERDTVDEF